MTFKKGDVVTSNKSYVDYLEQCEIKLRNAYEELSSLVSTVIRDDELEDTITNIFDLTHEALYKTQNLIVEVSE
ncbi:TPA: hypothetical protein ACGB9C_003129 [Listeria monocytogenes]